MPKKKLSLASWAAFDEKRIETLVLQLTNRCPYSCSQCYMMRGNENMHLETAMMAIRNAHEQGCRAVQFTGGEPLLYPYIYGLIEFCSSLGMYSMIATSGYGHSLDCYSKLKAAGLSLMCVSLNGISNVVNNLTRSHGDVAKEAIKDAVICAIPCFVNCVVSYENIDELSTIASFLKELGVSGISLLKRFPSASLRQGCKYSNEVFEKILHLVNQESGYVRVENCFKEYWEYVYKNKYACEDCGQKTFFVNVDGTYSPCSKLSAYRYQTATHLLNNRQEWESFSC